MEMARKHEHFGLSYLEELSILKERENMCKEARQQFLTFKRKAANDQTRLNKPLFQITPSDHSPQLGPNSCHTNLPVEQDTCISLKTVSFLPDVSLTKHQTQSLEAQQKKSPKKEDSKTGSHLDENEKGPVAIASLIGTAKQVSMLKKPEHPPRSKCISFVGVKSISEETFTPQQEVHDTKQPEQKIYSQQKITGSVGTSSVTTETDDSSTVDSSTSEKSLKMAKEISKPNILISILELENSDSKRSSEISNMKSVPGSSQETRGVRRTSTFEKSFPLSSSEALDSAQTFPAGVVPRSIDEIIASLQSTTPTPSDLRIKELLESILGENYNIKIEPPVKVSLKPEAKEKTPLNTLQESESEECQSPAEQATPADSEQTQLDPSRSSQRESIFPPIEEENIVEENTPKARAQEVLTEEPAEKPVVECPQKAPSLPESEEDVSYSDIPELYEPGSLVPEVLEEETSEELEEFDSVHSLKVRGKAFPKAEPVKIQKSSEDLPQQQPVSLLSTWTTKIKDVDHPLIHHLCTASPRCALPVDLQLVSRVSHTLDKKSHHVPLPAFNPGYYESEILFPAITLLEKQRETERILNEGLPVPEAYQFSQKDKNTVLPEHLLESVTEWQRKAEYYIEKPRLELLGEKVKLHEGTLKMFWTPAPLKFSAPLSVMKQTLFSKYESNLVNGVIYEDFSCDLLEEEKAESEDDFDNLLSSIKVDHRCYSCPEIPSSTTFKLGLGRRSASEPELLGHRDKSAFKISADFSVIMEELKVMKKQAPLTVVEVTSPEANISTTKDQKTIEKNPSDFYSTPVTEERGSSFIKEEIKEAALLAEASRKAGIKYIVFPRKKHRRKRGKYLSPELIQTIHVRLMDSPKILERTTSVGKLHSHNKYSIEVSQSVKRYRSPSLPCLLDFATFAKNKGGIPEHLSGYAWAKEIWNKWFDEMYPPIRETKIASVKKNAQEKPQVVKTELSDSALPMECETSQFDEFQSEIDRLTEQIKEGWALAFNYCRRGALCRKMGKLKTAMEDLEKAISLEPTLVDAYWHRHLLFLYQNKTIPALEDLNFIIKSNKNHADAYISRAEIYKKQGDNSLAIINYTLALRCRPTDDDIYFRRAEIYDKEGDIAMAIDDYSKSIYYNPRRTDALMKHGLYYFNKSNWFTAINDFTDVIKLDPNNAEARTFRGRVYIKQEEYKKAATDFSAAIHLDPCNWMAFYYRGCILRKIDPKQALQDFSISVLLNDDFENLSCFIHRGILYTEMEQWILAICDFESVVALDRSLTLPYVNIGLIMLLHLDRYFEAVGQFTSAIQMDPLDTRPYLCRAQAYHKIHKLQDSLKDITRAIHLQPNSPRLCLMRGQCLLDMKKYELAHFCLRQVAEMGQGSFECSIVQEALVQSFCQNHNRAIECALTATKKQPEPSTFVLLGKIQMKAKKHKDAVASFKEALKLLMGTGKTVPCTFEAAEMYYFIGQCYKERILLIELFSYRKYSAKLGYCVVSRLYGHVLVAFSPDISPASMADIFRGSDPKMQAKHQEKMLLEHGHATWKPHNAPVIPAVKAFDNTFSKIYCIIFQACDAFSTAVKLYPRYADAFYERGLCRMQLQQEKCILDFNKVLAISPKHFQAYLSRAAFFGSKGRYSKAIMNCTEAIRIHPKSVRAYLYRGTLKIYNKTYKNAVEDLDKTIELDNICILAYYNRGVCYHQMKDYKSALKDYSITLLLEPNKDITLKVLINRALIYAELDQYANSLEDFTEAALRNPKNGQLFQALGICYHRLQRYEEAVKSFSTVLKLNPFSLDGYIGRGNSYMEYGHQAGSKQAQKEFLKAIHLNPLCIKARLCLGYNLQGLGKFQKAWHQFSAAIQINPRCHIAYDGRAIVCLQMGDTFAAFQDINAALKVTASAELLTNRGVINHFMGYLSCAMKDYQRAVMVDPDYALAYFNAANIYLLKRQFSQARDYYSKALTLDATNESAFLNRAIANTLLKNFEEAKADFEEAVCLSPFSAAIYYNKANLYNTLKQYQQAEEDISKALAIQPYDSLMYKLRADIRGKLGFLKEAIADYKKAINIQELIFPG